LERRTAIVTIRPMLFDRTPPRRQAAAEGPRSTSDITGPADALAPQRPPALLVRLARRWWYQHELAVVTPAEGESPGVQLHP